jgi:hypothetical protein
MRSVHRALLTREIAELKADCLAFDAALRQARLDLWLRYDPNQPRVPAGSADGGRWTDGGVSGSVGAADPAGGAGGEAGSSGDASASAGGDSEWRTIARGVGPDGSRTETVARVDGTTIRSEYAASRAAGFDERHTVATPDGSVRTFETQGLTQSVHNDLGEVLSRSEFRPDGAVLEPASLQVISRLGQAARATYGAGVALYAWMSTHNDSQNQAIFTARSWGYAGGTEVVRVERMTRENAELVCGRFSEVQDRTNAAANSLAHLREGLSPTQYGTAVHTHVKHQIDALRNPDFRAEVSLLKSIEARYGHEGTVRIDVFERTKDNTVCVYDIKTGSRGMSMPRWDDIAGRANDVFERPRRIILTEIRPYQ